MYDDYSLLDTAAVCCALSLTHIELTKYLAADLFPHPFQIAGQDLWLEMDVRAFLHLKGRGVTLVPAA